MRLTRRDRIALGSGASILVGLGLWLLVYEPVRDHIELLERKVQAKEAEYRELHDLAQRFVLLRTSAQNVEDQLKRGKGFPVLTYLEKIAVDLDLRRRITQMRGKGGDTTRHYRENAIEIRMEKISLAELVRYLYLVENPRRGSEETALLRVRQLRVRSNLENKNLLDATFQVSGYELLEKT